MLDRALLVLLFPILGSVIHFSFVLNFYARPSPTAMVMAVEIPVFAVLWGRALSALIFGWKHPSARIQRFSSIGALLLSFWPLSTLLAIALIDPFLD